MFACGIEPGSALHYEGVHDVTEGVASFAQLLQFAGLHVVIDHFLHGAPMRLTGKQHAENPLARLRGGGNAGTEAVGLGFAHVFGGPLVADGIVVAMEELGVEISQESVHAFAAVAAGPAGVKAGQVLRDVDGCAARASGR